MLPRCKGPRDTSLRKVWTGVKDSEMIADMSD